MIEDNELTDTRTFIVANVSRVTFEIKICYFNSSYYSHSNQTTVNDPSIVLVAYYISNLTLKYLNNPCCFSCI